MNVPDDKTKLHPGSMLSPTALLRKQAEERLRHLEFLQQAKTINPAETRRLIHELNVHQIELEMQNDELQRTHIELEEMRARYFDLYNLAPVGYCTVGEKGVILEANLTAANLLGIAPRDLINQSFSRFIQNDDQDIYYLFRKRLDQTSTAQTCEVRLIRQDGTSFWAQLEAAIFPDAHGMAGSRVILSDITDRKTMEEEKSNQEAVNGQLQKAESLKRMAAAIAHHFNNKLHTVMGFLELSFEDIPPGKKLSPCSPWPEKRQIKRVR
jgi:PAS domain S-box-containing protein